LGVVGFEKAKGFENENPAVEEAEKGEGVVELGAELEANGNAGVVEAEDREEEEEEDGKRVFEVENGEADDDVPNWDKPVPADEAVVPNRVEPKPEVAAVDEVVPNRGESEVGAAEDDVVPNRRGLDLGAEDDIVLDSEGGELHGEEE
jgi:hypothetical protein